MSTAAGVRPGDTITLTLTVRDVLPGVLLGTRVQIVADGVLILLDPAHPITKETSHA